MTTPQRFRKKPVEIEAVQWDGTAEAATPIIDWALQNNVTITYSCPDGAACRRDTHVLLVCTLEGSMAALPGDWIIRGIQGEFYPCKPDIFEATYSTGGPPGPNLLDGTTEFMRLARQPAGEWEYTTAADITQLRALRMDLLAEEYSEYLNAERASDLVEIVDGLLDVIVIAWGTLISYIGEERAKAAAAEVVRSNLSKVIGDGLPIFREDGKVLKPESWQPPNIEVAIR
jgi:predicted HAD superfamily Cof-like phosphohydrolase